MTHMGKPLLIKSLPFDERESSPKLHILSVIMLRKHLDLSVFRVKVGILRHLDRAANNCQRQQDRQ